MIRYKLFFLLFLSIGVFTGPILAQNCSISATVNPICEGTSSTLQVNTDLPNPTSYTWNTSLLNNNTLNVSPTSTTPYSCIVSNGTTTCTTAVFTLTVNPTPNVIAQTQTICSAGTFTVSPINGSGNSVPTGTSYSWSAPSVSGISGTASGSSVSSISGTLTNTTNAAISVVYNVIPTSGSCSGSSFTVTVTVNPKPNVINQTQTICSAGTFTVSPINGSGNSVPTGTSYSWSAPSVSGITGTTPGSSLSSISGTLTNTTNAAINVVYIVIPTSGSCSGSSFTVTVTVNPTPNVTDPTDQVVCVGASAAVTFVSPLNVSGTLYTWTNNNTATGLSLGSTGNIASFTTTNTTSTVIISTLTVTPSYANAGITCTGIPQVFTITVKPRPSIANNSQSVCSNVNYLGNWTIPDIVPLSTLYTWSVTNNTQVIGETNNTIPQSFGQTLTNLTLLNQSVSYTITPTTNGCSGLPFTLILEVKPAPNSNAGLDFSITCIQNVSGAMIGASAIPGYTYAWIPISALSASTIANPIANPASTTIYTLTVTDPLSSCSSKDSVIVTVNNSVPLASAGNDGLITCITNPSGLLIGTGSVNGIAYSWFPTNGLSNANSSQTNAIPLTNTTYSLTAYNPVNGCTATDQVIVTVDNAVPIANAGSDFTKTCILNPNGAAIGTTAVAGNTYSWSPSTGLTSATISIPTANPSATTTYTLTATNTASGCTATDQVLVTVNNAVPLAYAGIDLTISCNQNVNGAVIGNLPEAGLQYSWSPTNGLSNTNSSQTNAMPSSTTPYTLTATNTASGCTATDQVLVIVNNSVPLANAGADFTKTCTLNPNGDTIGTSAVVGNTYSWSPTTNLTSSLAASTTANPSATTTYTLTATNTASGCTATDQVLVIVNNAVPLANAGADFTKTCTLNPNGTTIGTTAVAGNTYSWSPSTGLTSATISIPTANPSATTPYTLTATNTASGCTATDQVIVTVNNSLPTVNAGTNDTICNGSSLALSGVSNANNIFWTPSSLVSNPGSLTPSANIQGTTTFTLTATGLNGCTSSDFVIITVNDLPQSGLSNNYEICSNENLQLNVSPNLTCLWNGLLNSTLNSINQIVDSSGTIFLEITDTNNCSTTEEITINLLPIPYPIITGAAQLCQNSYWVEYSVPSTSNFLDWSVVNGEFQSDSSSNVVYIHWTSINPSNQMSGQVIITETIASTGCQNSYLKNIILDTTVSLNPATVLALSSNVLYTTEDYSFMNWGYESIVTHIPVSVGVYSQYCNYNNIDLSSFNYWVEISNGNNCITKSYFNPPIFTASTIENIDEIIRIYPNPATDMVQFIGNFSHFNSYKLIDINGQIICQNNFDATDKLDVSKLESGIYFILLEGLIDKLTIKFFKI